MVTRIGKKQRVHLYIEEWMAFKGMSYEDIGRRLDKSRTTVWRWVKEQHRLDPSKIAALAHAMDLKGQDFWRIPPRESLDAMVEAVPDDVFDRIKDIIQTLTRRAS